MKNKNYIHSIDAEKTFVKNQHDFLLKIEADNNSSNIL